MRSFAPMPTVGTSIASTSFGATPLLTSTMASPPRTPGSMPRILMACPYWSFGLSDFVIASASLRVCSTCWVRLMGGVTRTPPVKDISRSESFDEDVPDGLGADLAYSLDLLRLGHGIPQQHDERLGAEQLLHAVRGEFLFCGLERQRGLLFALDIFAVVNDVMHGLVASSWLSFRSGKPFNGGHRLRGARRRFGVMPVSSDRTAVRTDRAGRASCGRC